MLKFLKQNWKLLGGNQTKQLPRFFVMCEHLPGEFIEDNLSLENKWFPPVSSKVFTMLNLDGNFEKVKTTSPDAALALTVELHAFMEWDPSPEVDLRPE